MARGGSCFGLTGTANGTLVHGDVYGAIRTLALCRQSCRRMYRERKGASFLFNISILFHYLYRAEKNGWYVVARYFFLALLSFSAWPCLAVA